MVIFRILSSFTIIWYIYLLLLSKKEKSYVDYFVSDNGAVSRSHADIVTKDNGFFILDHNSTNKTYLNDNVIVPKIELEIIDGIKIRLADEEFIFHLK